MDKQKRQPTPQPTSQSRQPYQKPRILSETIFETTALACGKCVSGPFSQFACSTIPRNS